MKSSLMILLLLFANVASADIVCTAPGQFDRGLRVTVRPYEVVVDQGALTKPRVYKDVQRANGLITARGLALHTKNQYGCIRMAVLITDTSDLVDTGYMNVTNMGTCTGGSTADDICLGERMPTD